MESIKPKVLNYKVFNDDRGFSSILFDADIEAELSSDFRVVQINQGFSSRAYTLRGLHYQVEPHAQAKLCYALSGSVFNVALNLGTGEVYTATLKPGIAMFIPRGYAHGYLTLESNTLFQWCVDNDFDSDAARVLHFSLVETWPVDDWSKVKIGEKDRNGAKWSG